MDKKQIDAVSDKLIKLVTCRFSINAGENFTTHAHVAIKRCLKEAIHFNTSRDSDLHDIVKAAGFTDGSRYSMQDQEALNALDSMQQDGLILGYSSHIDRSYSHRTDRSWKIQPNPVKLEEIYKDRIWKRADFQDDNGGLWTSFSDFCREASARSIMHLARDPGAFIIEASARHSCGIIKPADPSLNPPRVLKDASKLRNTLKRAISEHFCESMTLITGTEMKYCLGVGLMTETIYWTPTVEDKTMNRLANKIKHLAEIRDESEQAFEQMTRLEQLYITHGKGRQFLKWAASELEKVLFDDPGKYIHDDTFGETAKEMLKYMN